MICVESVSVSPSAVSLTAGSSYYNASVEVYPPSADCTEVIWHSDNNSVATVDPSSGNISPNAPGSARIYATATDGSGCSDYLTVYVSAPACAECVTLKHALTIGESITLRAYVCPENAINQSVNWHSSDDSVATVTDGVVTAVSQGTAVITATTAEGSYCCASYYVTVIQPTYLADHLTGVHVFSYKDDGHKYLSKNFKVSEFQCQDWTDPILIDMKLVKYLQAIRDWAGAPITINSGYRTPAHNVKPDVGGVLYSQHIYGRAADIACSTKTPLELAKQAYALGVMGIEWNKDGNYTHIDTRTSLWHIKREDGENKNVNFEEY